MPLAKSCIKHDTKRVHLKPITISSVASKKRLTNINILLVKLPIYSFGVIIRWLHPWVRRLSIVIFRRSKKASVANHQKQSVYHLLATGKVHSIWCVFLRQILLWPIQCLTSTGLSNSLENSEAQGENTCLCYLHNLFILLRKLSFAIWIAN